MLCTRRAPSERHNVESKLKRQLWSRWGNSTQSTAVPNSLQKLHVSDPDHMSEFRDQVRRAHSPSGFPLQPQSS